MESRSRQPIQGPLRKKKMLRWSPEMFTCRMDASFRGLSTNVKLSHPKHFHIRIWILIRLRIQKCEHWFFFIYDCCKKCCVANSATLLTDPVRFRLLLKAKVGTQIFLIVRKSQIFKFLVSFCNRKSANFWGVLVAQIVNPHICTVSPRPGKASQDTQPAEK